MKKKAQVIMLPTDKVDDVVMKWRDGKIRNHHLYIVTDDEIKEGDWCYDALTGLFQYGVTLVELLKNSKKIIATTDPELTVLKDVGDEFEVRWEEVRIAQPSKDFIEKYCKVGGIDEVEVEYQVFPYKTGDIVSKTYRLKVNSHNEITIHPIKDRWTREEIEEKCREVFELGASAFQDCLNPHTLEFDHETFKRLKEEAINQNK